MYRQLGSLVFQRDSLACFTADLLAHCNIASSGKRPGRGDRVKRRTHPLLGVSSNRPERTRFQKEQPSARFFLNCTRQPDNGKPLDRVSWQTARRHAGFLPNLRRGAWCLCLHSRSAGAASLTARRFSTQRCLTQRTTAYRSQLEAICHRMPGYLSRSFQRFCAA